MKCAICKREMPEQVNCGGDCVMCMAEAGDPECLETVIFYKDQPDHDAEVLGYKDGEAPTTNSLFWAYINKGYK